MLDCLLPNVKFLFRLALGLTHDDGWKMPRSLFAGTLGLGFSGVVSVSGILYSALRLSGVLEMSSFLDLAERSTEVSSEGDLGLLLGSLSLPGAVLLSDCSWRMDQVEVSDLYPVLEKSMDHFYPFLL